jgi:hypothetical protein
VQLLRLRVGQLRAASDARVPGVARWGVPRARA